MKTNENYKKSMSKPMKTNDINETQSKSIESQ